MVIRLVCLTLPYVKYLGVVTVTCYCRSVETNWNDLATETCALKGIRMDESQERLRGTSLMIHLGSGYSLCEVVFGSGGRLTRPVRHGTAEVGSERSLLGILNEQSQCSVSSGAAVDQSPAIEPR